MFQYMEIYLDRYLMKIQNVVWQTSQIVSVWKKSGKDEKLN